MARVALSISVPGVVSIQWTSSRSSNRSTDRVPGVSVMLFASRYFSKSLSSFVS